MGLFGVFYVCFLRMPLRSVIYFLLAGITHQSKRLSILLNSNKLPLIPRPFLANVIKFLRLCVINSRPTATHPGTFISAHMYVPQSHSQLLNAGDDTSYFLLGGAFTVRSLPADSLGAIDGSTWLAGWLAGWAICQYTRYSLPLVVVVNYNPPSHSRMSSGG